MSKQGQFLIYVVEKYRSAKHLSGKAVEALFTKYDVWDYIYSCFEALHTTGDRYLIHDIDEYIAAKQ